jgi:hypothetical protein
MIENIYNFFGFWGLYFLVGFIYTMINILVRKLPQKDDHFDPSLVFVWLCLPWLGIVSLIIKFIIKKTKKHGT